MKYYAVLIVALFYYDTSHAQNFVLDSTRFSNNLTPFRKHLDSLSDELGAEELAALHSSQYKPKGFIEDDQVIQNSASLFIDEEKQFSYNYQTPLVSPTHTVDEIVTDDQSTTTYFTEKKYDIPNRYYLYHLEIRYGNATTDSDRIKTLLKYVLALNKTYPSQKLAFSKSHTLVKYTNKIQEIFRLMPNDTTKVDLLILYAKTLTVIDESWWRSHIFSIYTEAKTILLEPYRRLIAAHNVPLHDSIVYKKFFIKHNATNRLLDIYIRLTLLLTPQNTYNVNNELYELKKKSDRYATLFRRLLNLAISFGNAKKESLDDFDCAYISYHSKLVDLRTSKFITQLFDDASMILIEHHKDLLTESILSAKKRFYLYYTLANMFFDLGEDRYAMLAYLKSLEIVIRSNKYLDNENYTTIFYKLFLLLGRNHQSSSPHKRISLEVPNMISFYNKTNIKASYKRDSGSALAYAKSAIIDSKIHFLGNETEKAKKALNDAKKDLLKGGYTPHSEKYFFFSLALLYKEIKDNGWLSDHEAEFEDERKLDSFYLSPPSNTEIIPVFDGNPFISEQLSTFNRIETESDYNYQISLLNKTIKAKEKEISNLDSEKRRLLDIEAALKLKIDTAELKLGRTQKQNDSLLKTNDSLSSDIATLGNTLDSLQIKIKNLNTEISSYKRIRNELILGIIILGIIGAGCIVWLAKKIKGLLSRMEANKRMHEALLKYENEKVLRELTLKHEIVGIFKNLYASFENVISDIKRTVSNTQEILLSFRSKLDKLASFASFYYETLSDKGYNSINTEVALASQYVEFYKIQRSSERIHFQDNRQHNNIAFTLPHHTINNLVMNSLQEGILEHEPLHISITDTQDSKGYSIHVIDDGKGVGQGFNLSALDSGSTGIRNLQKQVEYYNSRASNDYHIYFDESSVRDRRSVDGARGTIVTILITKKHGNL